MTPKTQVSQTTGPVGTLEIQIDEASTDTPFQGVAVIAHPHPLYGGDMNNKVVATLAKVFSQMGWRAVRFNFRGVGKSEGTYSEGLGETDDLLAVIASYAPTGALCLAGFSFGTFVVSRALQQLKDARNLSQDVQRLVFVGAAAGRFELAPIAPDLHERLLVVHGENDDTVPLAAVMDWARPQTIPVTVVPNGSHFFHGQLPLLKNLVLKHLR